ncbi:MAG: Dam family site-specific DNA-(adenine-N6)-methyltransferase [Oscillospiraceae bacterium]|nr:Dam family site-specific DNA-(adenine-N6)-methyltransferase [Oscillospiraceae bacterium]
MVLLLFQVWNIIILVLKESKAKTMLAYMTANEAAEKWNISHRRVITLCQENRILNAAMLGNMWIIPIDANKPEDARSLRYNKSEEKNVKPFLKWAGGKSQLLNEIEKYYPFADSNFTKYAEPLVGGGAVLFDIISKYDLERVYISDTNAELINTYIIVRDNIDSLIGTLYSMQSDFLSQDTDGRKCYYVQKRERFNSLIVNGKENINIEKAALMIFLNKTCFNGLYRVNKKGLFNVPIGSYKNPLICDEKNLRAVSEKLQSVTIVCGDYKESASFIDEHTFVYFDPPYRPITKTSNFTAYTENMFNDEEHIDLARFVDEMDRKGARIVISNSDPKNANTEDDFFDSIYSSHRIRRVEAARMINCNSEARGKIKELLISNF